MIKIILGSLLGLGLTASAVMAQIPTQLGVSSGTTVLDIRSVTLAESESWGDFSEIGVAVNAGAAGSFGIDLDNLGLTASLTEGGTAGFNIYEIEGGFFNTAETTTRISGRSITSETNL